MDVFILDALTKTPARFQTHDYQIQGLSFYR